MSSPLVNIIAKTLSGDLFALSTEPSMDAIRTALSAMDPLMFPPRHTIVQPIDNAPLADGSIVMVLVNPNVRCTFIGATDETITLSDGDPLTMRHWSFILESGEPFHVYRKIQMMAGIRMVRYHACTHAIQPEDFDRERTYTRAVEDSLMLDLSSKPRDWYVIKTVIHRMEEILVEEWLPRFRPKHAVCTCGAIIGNLFVKAHLLSKQHLTNVVMMNEFMKEVEEDLAALSKK